MARGKTTPKASRRKSRKLKGRIAAKKKKEFVYRGKTLQELQEMSHEEFIELLPARARRTINRGIQSKNQKFFKHLERDDEVTKTHAREIVIIPEMVNKRLAIHDGRQFVEVTVTPEMIGHMVGEFALTRKQVRHTGVGVGATRSSKYMPLK